MPYSKPSDAPDHVPADKKAQWVKVWNSVYDAAKKDGASDKDAEAKAFAEANGVAKRNHMSKLERSYIPFEVTEVRAEQDGEKRYISGYASVYKQPTDKVGFREVVMPGAFDRALKEKQDVRALINHNPDMVLGRSKSGTLDMSSDNKGLKFRVEMPNTSYANDLMELCKRGDMNQCSFGFRPVKQAWVQEPDPEDNTRMIATRQLHDVDLGDVSVVTYPAYDGTSAKVGRTEVSAAEFRAFFPNGIPEDVAENVKITIEPIAPAPEAKVEEKREEVPAVTAPVQSEQEKRQRELELVKATF